MKVRAVMLAIIGLAVLYTGVSHPVFYGADAAGILIGSVLAFYAIRHCKIEYRGANLFYRTHIFIESAIAGLFIARIAYRFLFRATTLAPGISPIERVATDPITLVVIFILVSYYIGYYGYLLRAANRLPPRPE